MFPADHDPAGSRNETEDETPPGAAADIVESVAGTKSSLALNQVKYSTALPLGA